MCVLTSSSVLFKPFLSFSGLIAVAKTFNTMLSRSGESGYLGLVLLGLFCMSPEAFPEPLL